MKQSDYQQYTQMALALGGNIGDPQATLTAALSQLAATPGMQLIATSSWYRTKAVGPPQPDYINGCATFQVEMTPQLVLEILLATEQKFGRVRQERWGPRSLDLDLLLYNQVVMDTPILQIPHPRMRERAFVLVPLAEIAPDWIDPVSGYTIKQLVKDVDCSDVQLLKIN